MVLIGKMAHDEQTIIRLAWQQALANGLNQAGKSRYSNRQKQKIRQDGLIGKIELYNVSERLYYLFYLG